MEGVAAESANARQRLEKMARAFKDEIDTLNEALVIAARDIAEAADSEIESESEREGGEVQEARARARQRTCGGRSRGRRSKKAPTRFARGCVGAYEAKERRPELFFRRGCPATGDKATVPANKTAISAGQTARHRRPAPRATPIGPVAVGRQLERRDGAAAGRTRA